MKFQEITKNCLLLVLLCFLGMIRENAIAQAEDAENRYLTIDSLLSIKVSTVAKYDQTIQEAPASVTIISAEEIELYGYRTLDEVLMGVRGFYTSYDRNYSYLGVRGFSRPTDFNDRVLLLINGHTINENVYGGAPVGTESGIDLETIERIEIARGPGSALYGTGAIFGVINLVTKKGNAIDGARISAEGGSYGRRQISLGAGKKLDNGLDIAVSGMWCDVRGHDLYFSEYDSAGGFARNLDWDSHYGVWTSLRYRDLELSGNIVSREKGIPTASYGDIFNDSRAQTLDERKYAELKYQKDLDKDKNIMLRLYYHHYDYRGTYPAEILNFDATDGNWYGGELQFRWDVLANNRIVAGSEYIRNPRADYRVWDITGTQFDNNYPYNLFSFYCQDEYQLAENLLLTLGLRRDGYSSAGSSTTPRFALVYHPFNSGTLKLLYAEAFRAPNVYELNFFDNYNGFKSNPSLSPEKIKATEVIWEQRLSEAVMGGISVFDYHMSDLIDTEVDPSDSLMQFKNVDRAKAIGVELELTGRFGTGQTGYASYSYQEARDPDLNEVLTNSPKQLFKFGLSSPIVRHVRAALELYYETGRLTVYNTMTNPFFLANLNIVAGPFLDGFVGSFRVRNLFSAAYGTPGGLEHKQSGIEQDGRNYLFRIEYKF